MRTWMIGIGLALASITMSCAQVKEIRELDFTVLRANDEARVVLSEPIEEVVRSLGRPLEMTTKKKSDQESSYVQYVYKGLTIGFFEHDQKVTLLRITGIEYTTSRHITVGATMDQVKTAYGPVEKEWPTVIQYHLRDASSKLGLDLLLSFWTEGQIVNGIDINRAP